MGRQLGSPAEALRGPLAGPFDDLRKVALRKCQKAARTHETRTAAAESLGLTYRTWLRLVDDFPEIEAF